MQAHCLKAKVLKFLLLSVSGSSKLFGLLNYVVFNYNKMSNQCASYKSLAAAILNIH